MGYVSAGLVTFIYAIKSDQLQTILRSRQVVTFGFVKGGVEG